MTMPGRLLPNETPRQAERVDRTSVGKRLWLPRCGQSGQRANMLHATGVIHLPGRGTDAVAMKFIIDLTALVLSIARLPPSDCQWIFSRG